MINTNNCSNIFCISNKYDTIKAEVNIPNKNKESNTVLNTIYLL